MLTRALFERSYLPMGICMCALHLLTSRLILFVCVIFKALSSIDVDGTGELDLAEFSGWLLGHSETKKKKRGAARTGSLFGGLQGWLDGKDHVGIGITKQAAKIAIMRRAEAQASCHGSSAVCFFSVIRLLLTNGSYLTNKH